MVNLQLPLIFHATIHCSNDLVVDLYLPDYLCSCVALMLHITYHLVYDSGDLRCLKFLDSWRCLIFNFLNVNLLSSVLVLQSTKRVSYS